MRASARHARALSVGIGRAGIESGGGEKLGAGFGKLILARKEQAEREVSLKRIGVGGHGSAVESGSIVETVSGVGDIASVKEGTRVSGMGCEISIEFGFGCFPVGCGNRRFG